MRRLIAALACAWLCTGCAQEPVPLPPVPSPAEVEQRRQAEQSARQLAEMIANVEKAYRDAIRPLVGDDPVPCNGDRARPRSMRDWQASPEQLATWFRCVHEARAAGRTSVIALDHPVEDGRYMTGILGSRDGVLRAFIYSEDCCGGRKGTLRAGPCEAPTAQGRHPGLYGVHCRNEDRHGSVPTPELWSREVGLPPDLSARLQSLTGDGAIDCGFELNEVAYFRQARQLLGALGCMRSAAASGRASWLLVPSERAGSLLVHGLVRQPSGADRELQYTRPVRVDADHPSAIDVRDCATPRVVRARDGGAEFTCTPVSTSRAPRSHPRPAP